jgi:nanoRNase/pAp phosphatase (c-di-AMP/oligoRNAs hydrolase)
MIAMNDAVAALFKDPTVRKIEIDHHLQSDAVYSGDSGYCLVSEASSTCEHIGYLGFKLAKQMDHMRVRDFFSRNIALAILTGIVGDSHMGKYLKTDKERWYYNTFSSMFDRMLIEKTNKNSRNISSMEVLFDTIQRFSVREQQCFDRILEDRRKSRSIGYIALGKEKSAELFETYGVELIVNVSKAVTDTLAEGCGRLGLVAYYDDPSLSNFVQFRLRRSAKFLDSDLRTVLTGLKIENGGGHPGAIGFRVPKDSIKDLESYTADLVDKVIKLTGISA